MDVPIGPTNDFLAFRPQKTNILISVTVVPKFLAGLSAVIIYCSRQECRIAGSHNVVCVGGN